MTSRHENCDKDKHADEDGLPRLRDGELGQNPNNHGEDENQQEEANKDVHTPQSNPEPTSGGMECDHRAGLKFMPFEGFDPVRVSHLWITTIGGERDIRFTFCPDCGSRLITP